MAVSYKDLRTSLNFDYCNFTDRKEHFLKNCDQFAKQCKQSNFNFPVMIIIKEEKFRK